MKKTAIFALTLVLTTCLLTGCRGNVTETTAPATTNATVPATTNRPTTTPSSRPTNPAATDNATNGNGVVGDIIDDITGTTRGAGRMGGMRG